MFESKHYWVVGGTRGIGRAITKRLAADGHNVYVSARTVPDDNGFDQYESITYFPLDVTEDGDNPTSLPEHIDGMVYCPGTITLKPLRTVSIDDFRSDFERNVLGAVRCTQWALPRLKSSTTGSLVYFSTVAVGQGMPFHSSIAAAKGAVEGYCRSIAAELAPKIRVNCIAPSLIDTDLSKRLLANEKKREDAAARHPLQRVGTPSDVASLAVFMLSDASAWMTGQVIGVDGGLSHLRTL